MCKIFFDKLSFIFIASAFLSASCDEVLEKPLDDFKVILSAPGNNIVTQSPVIFNWDALASASSYRVRIMSPGFDTAQVLIFDTIVTRNLVSLPLEARQYQWRVQAINSSSRSQESDIRNLTVE